MLKFKLLVLLICSTLLVHSQSKTSLKGLITDNQQKPLSGVNVFSEQIKHGTITNNVGEYEIQNVPAGALTIKISYTGYQSQIVNTTIKEGANILNIVLEPTAYDLQGVVVSAQKVEQQIQDVPISVSAISNQTITNLHIQNLDEFAGLVPGLNIRIQSNQHPNFVIRGLSSDEVSPNAQPRVSLFMNNAPLTQASSGVLELYDMERIEVLKGPQGTLFGRGAQIGAVHFLTKMPTNEFEGFVSGGFGSYSQVDLSTAVNIPIIKNKLNTRIAAVYNTRDGYVKNTFGGTLNGKNTTGLRFSVRYLPGTKTKIDFIYNYQKDDAPGIAFMSKLYPNTKGITDIFSYEASLDKGDQLKTNKETSNFLLNIRHYFNDHLFLSSITSYQTNNSYERWDGDGTAAEAIDMSGTVDADLLSQEIRLNYSFNNRLNGFSGLNYLLENVSQNYWFSPNETHMVHLFLDPTYMIMPDGSPYSMLSLPNIPQLGPLAGMPLSSSHEEENRNSAENRALEFFTDATYTISPKFKISGGIRIVTERSIVDARSLMVNGSPATLGFFTGNYPNLFFLPTELNSTQSNFNGFTSRLAAHYKFNEQSGLFASYAKGRRPNVIQYQANGTSEILDAEIVNSFEIGYKAALKNQLLFDASVFYYNYNNFQTNAWIADPETGDFAYLIKDGGKANTYGFETSFQYNVSEHLKLSGNYAFIHARFNKKDKDGNEQEYADHHFRLTPEHSFNVNLNYETAITSEIKFFATPSVSYKSHFFFEDANTAGIEQDAYAIMNMVTGFRLLNPDLTLSIFSHNLLNQKYLLGAGNTGSLFGIPTFVPAIPRTFGFKVRWDF